METWTHRLGAYHGPGLGSQTVTARGSLCVAGLADRVPPAEHADDTADDDDDLGEHLAPGYRLPVGGCRSDDRGDPVIQFAPPLIMAPEQIEEMGAILRPILEGASDRLGL